MLWRSDIGILETSCARARSTPRRPEPHGSRPARLAAGARPADQRLLFVLLRCTTISRRALYLSISS